MRRVIRLLCLATLSAGVVHAQDAPEPEGSAPESAAPAPEDVPAAPESVAPVTEAEPTYPAAPKLPPLPAAGESFKADQSRFGDVKTAPEEAFLLEIERGRQRIALSQPAYMRQPGFAYTSEAAGGIFGAGILGLVSGAVGDAVDPGDESQPLGGAHGRAFGLLGGGYLGASLGVWGAARLFEKPVNPAWSFLGAGLGSVIGGGAATGIMFALEDDRQTAGTLAVVTLIAFQVGGAILLTEVGMPDEPLKPSAPAATPRR